MAEIAVTVSDVAINVAAVVTVVARGGDVGTVVVALW